MRRSHRSGVTLLEAAVGMVITSTVLMASLSLFGSAMTTYRATRQATGSEVSAISGEADLVAVGRQVFTDPVALRSDVRVARGVPIVGVPQDVLTYEAVRGFRAPLAGADWSLVEDAAGELISGAIWLLQRAPTPAEAAQVDPDYDGAPGIRYLDSRLLKIEVPRAVAARYRMPRASFGACTAGELSGYLSRPEVWRTSEMLAENVHRVTLDASGGLAWVIQEYHAR